MKYHSGAIKVTHYGRNNSFIRIENFLYRDRGLRAHLLIGKATGHVVIYHAGSLHECINDC